jgi:alkanesulfonate monooxygenase SsuD/methylene tetrahydromethanopterin reductase-like flavin-dependent oxidoreductase (luciferase family)
LPSPNLLPSESSQPAPLGEFSGLVRRRDLPNYGLDSNPDGIRRAAELAEELRFGSVWAREHIIVGPEAVDPYFYAPLVTLGWTERIGLGRSIMLVPPLYRRLSPT